MAKKKPTKRHVKTIQDKANKKIAAKKGKKAANATIEKLRQFIRTEGTAFLKDPNITSIGVGQKITEGKRTSELCVQFTVRIKPEVAGSLPENVATKRIPEILDIAGFSIPTDVIQRSYEPSVSLLSPESIAQSVSDRKKRLEPMVPGISVAHPSVTAGTFGMVVYDNHSGDACILSNWHVLQSSLGNIGDEVVQPGPADNNTSGNSAGILVRSHLGAAGDCAIARIKDRSFKSDIFELGVKPAKIGRVDLGDPVIKSGRTTGVTHGIVRRIDVMANINYSGIGQIAIGCFEIEPRAGVPSNHEISKGGDSGSVWLIENQQGKPTDVMVGLHFAGETQNDPDEHALACYAHSVIKKLDISISPIRSVELEPAGFDIDFLSEKISFPALSDRIQRDAFKLDGKPILNYTHFSVCQSRSRRLPRFVAWNIDGSRLNSVSRKGIKFKRDPRVEAEFQAGDEIYSGNKLDRGHIARRADLTWGSLAEAKRANLDSFYFTNITPQHEAFNQSSKAGLWGKLENAILEEVEVDGLRISVMAGPVLRDDDQEYREVRIPSEYWKLIAYKDTADGKFKIKAYIVTQRDLLDDIEAFELDPFRLFQVSLSKLESETGLRFSHLSQFEALVAPPQSERLLSKSKTKGVREVLSHDDLFADQN